MSNVDYTEPYSIPDTFISGIAFVDQLAGNLYRVTYYAEGRSTYGPREAERTVVARFLMSGETLAALQKLGPVDTSTGPDELNFLHVAGQRAN